MSGLTFVRKTAIAPLRVDRLSYSVLEGGLASISNRRIVAISSGSSPVAIKARIKITWASARVIGQRRHLEAASGLLQFAVGP